MELTSNVLIEIAARIASDWCRDSGCRFTIKDGAGVPWNIAVYAYNKWDCRATKRGTQGKTHKTFERFTVDKAVRKEAITKVKGGK